MKLATAIEKAKQTAEALKAAKSDHEANTKALVIEPVLGALGWDLTDLNSVDREYSVFDGTRLDYALMIEGEPRLFVEAKGAGRNISDKNFISQTVNYANNEGVPWCVLTNGLTYRVYKTNEPVGMAEKMLFEVDLEDADSGGSGIEELSLIGRASVEAGQLDDWGERVFTDTRVRRALAEVAVKSPTALIDPVTKRLGQPPIGSDQIAESLGRILGAEMPPKKATNKASGTKSSKPTGSTYSLDHHLAGKPAGIVDLFEQVDDYGQSLGGDVTRRIKKMYVGYYAGSNERSFFTAQVQRQGILLYLSVPPNEAKPWNPDAMRDMISPKKIGHYGMGDTEYLLLKPDHLEEVKALITQAYEQVH